MDKELKNLYRKQRILRIHAVVKAFSAYTKMEVNRKVLFCDNTWQSAENTKNLIDFFFPDKDTKVEDFIHNPDDLTEKVLNYYQDYKGWVTVTEFLGVPESTIESFCKNVFNTWSVLFLRTHGHFHYPMYFNALYNYLDNAISKDELKAYFVEYSIFTGKPSPASFAHFKYSIRQIETLLSEIVTKQAERSCKSVNEFILESQLNEKKLADIPF